MSTALSISLVALCSLILLETIALKAILRESAWLTRMYRSGAASRDAMEVALGKTLPPFSLPTLDSDEYLTDRDIRGRFAILLFLTRADVVSLDSAEMRSMMAGLLTHAEECLYLVCEGSRSDASWIRDLGQLEETYAGYVSVLIDDSGRLRKILGIASTPSCAIFEEDGSLKRVGHPVVGAGNGPARHAA